MLRCRIAAALVLAFACLGSLAGFDDRAARGEGSATAPSPGPSSTPSSTPSSPIDFTVDPPQVRLQGANARYTLLVQGQLPVEGAGASPVDLTSLASFRSLHPEVAEVSPRGVVRALADGTAEIEVAYRDQTRRVQVEVADTQQPRHFNFENDIVPLLSRYGCNASGCHGKAEGQNGFKLSVFGFDPAADYDALTKESRGRRVFPAAPERSLLLTKASGGAPHGGGVRIRPDTPEYQTLHDWIAAGLPRGQDDDPRVAAIRLEPRERLLRLNSGEGIQPGNAQQLRVIATYTDGRQEDVTALSRFQSNNEGLAAVDEAGLVTAGQAPGHAAVMASFQGAVDVFQMLAPRAEAAEFPESPVRNFIDRLAYDRMQKLNILPSGPASDADYLRRVYLDVIGTLPTPDEAREFLADASPDKRQRLVERLLQRPEYADYWGLFWADLLRVDRDDLGGRRAYNFYAWIRDSLRANKPYDAWMRELVTAEGPLTEAPQGAYFLAHKRPGDTASAVSQVLLGVRIACAECHHHPFDRWSQQDYFGMERVFASVGRKQTPGEMVLFGNAASATKHPRTGENVFPYPLGETMPAEAPAGDVRRQFADWLTQPDNPWFARAVANRVWARFMGRGLVEPVDDFRDTNPPSHPELLDALARQFVESGYDLQALMRTIADSHLYQLSSAPNDTNQSDTQSYSRFAWKRLPAEVMLDAVCQTTGVPEKFGGVAAGPRAIELWDNRVPHYFLKLFGRPLRETTCECERNSEASIAQVLHLLNSPEIHAKITHADGRISRLVEETADNERLVEELYLGAYSRYPSSDERQAALEYLQSAPDRRRAAEDLAWSLMNTLEFVFNH